MISWPKAIASAVKACLHCSSCTAHTPFTELRIIRILFPSPLPPRAICNMNCLCPGWQMEKQDTLLFAVAVLHGLNWPVKLQCSSLAALAEQPFWRPLLSLCHCCECVYALCKYTSISSSPCCFQERLSHLNIFSCCLWISASLVYLLGVLWPLLCLNPSLKFPLLAFGNFQFLLVSY